MASMWRRAMVYLGLQDDDELDYGGEYESYGDYGDHRPTSRSPRRRRRRSERGPRARPRREPAHGDRRTGTRRTPPTTAAPDPAPPRAAAARDEPSGMSVTRPSVVRTIGPTTAARVHVVEPRAASTTRRRSATASRPTSP